jgi:ferric-dicitrate binding protein FerR (iron transport regulator)
MNLTDKEILELNELCAALVDGTLTQNQKARLSHLLSTSDDARRVYVRTMGLSASLYSYASEMQTEKADVVIFRESAFLAWWRQMRWAFGSLTAAAAVIAILVWMNLPQKSAAIASPNNEESVALLTGAKNCQWVNSSLPVQPGSQLHKGQHLELADGFAEVTFDSGAKVVLEGPASLDVKSAWAAILNSGNLKASVPSQAVGFSISNPNVEVVDLGTEFTMSANANGSADVLVLKGQVEAQSRADAARQPIVLGAKESMRFASSGISTAGNVEQKFAQLTKPLALDHFEPPTDIVHWSFNETGGSIFKADAQGGPVNISEARLKEISPGTASDAHTAGKWGNALKFDGHVYAKASFPGLSGISQHTVAFWVKVAKDAKLSNAYSMVAWGVNNEKLGSHPIHIGWNRNPNEGTVGVLRTDYGGGYAMGSTPLRDGQWHHIAVILTPNEDADKTMEVKQYVDGRLEGEGQSSPPGSAVFKQLTSEKKFSLNDIVWLGCRVGINGVRTERFCGEMDELYIADRALEPQEIVSLMNFNQLQVEVTDAVEE